MFIKTNNQENIIIDVLKFGLQKLKCSKDFTVNELKEYLHQRYDKGFVSFCLENILKENFLPLRGDKYRINSNGYSRLLSYNSLKKSRQSIHIAIFAIFLSLISFLVSIYLSFFRISTFEFTDKQQSDFHKEFNEIEDAVNRSIHNDSIYFNEYIKLLSDSTRLQPNRNDSVIK